MAESSENNSSRRPGKGNVIKNVGSKVDSLFLDKEGEMKKNYTGDDLTERDYRPVRRSREYRSGCLGGVMYFVFILCISIVLACVAWMAASDALALNKDNFTVSISLPKTIFSKATVDELDDDGNVIGTSEVTRADIDYVASELMDNGLIHYKWLFEFFCRISKADMKLDPGDYTLKSSYDYRALVQHMQSGFADAVTVTVMIPEGYTMHQIFRKLEENEVCSYEALMEAAANANFNYSFLDETLAGDPSRLEGYLFPDTYEFYVGMQASSAINKFLRQFNVVLSADMIKQASDRGMSVTDIIKIASLIEKEAAVLPDSEINERTLVSSVIYNRIAKSMSLGLESSILYLYPDHEGAPDAEMLAEDTPYNLNINTGLPPTPICNPGKDAIMAALNPEESSYLYFTLDTETGAHRFFRNYDEFTAFAATQNYG